MPMCICHLFTVCFIVLSLCRRCFLHVVNWPLNLNSSICITLWDRLLMVSQWMDGWWCEGWMNNKWMDSVNRHNSTFCAFQGMNNIHIYICVNKSQLKTNILITKILNSRSIEGRTNFNLNHLCFKIKLEFACIVQFGFKTLKLDLNVDRMNKNIVGLFGCETRFDHNRVSEDVTETKGSLNGLMGSVGLTMNSPQREGNM